MSEADDVKRWELIAEASKRETTDVYCMLLRAFDAISTPNHTSFYFTHLNLNININSEHKYQSCPPAFLKFLFETNDEVSTIFSSINTIDVSSYTWMDTEKEGKKKNKNKNSKSADEIRTENIISKMTKQIPDILHVMFPTEPIQIVEGIVINYCYTITMCYKTKDSDRFINALLSLRDALQFFNATCHPNILEIGQRTLQYYEILFPWKTFFKKYTKYLIKNHFNGIYQKAIQPFPEQQEFLEHLKLNARRLFVLPWGVGCGKTACVAPLSTIFMHVYNKQTFYCVPFGPTQDQTAANLYRNGIPFAYIATNLKSNNTMEFVLQPSFHCSDGKSPHVFIVDTAFMSYYIKYWNQHLTLVLGEHWNEIDYAQHPQLFQQLDISDNLPAIQIPRKRRYVHIPLTLWTFPFALIIDEPCRDDPQLQYILHHLPETTMILSATSCDIITPEIMSSYKEQNPDGSIATIHGQTIGVSTTLIGYWLENNPILTPFSGVQSREEFRQRLHNMSTNILWRRFLSPTVLVYWLEYIIPRLPNLPDETNEGGGNLKSNYLYSFNLMTINYDEISKRLIRWCQTIYKQIQTDAWYQEIFQFPRCKSHHTIQELIHTMCYEDCYRFGNGCIIASTSNFHASREFDFMIAQFPTVLEIQELILQHQHEIVTKCKQILTNFHTQMTNCGRQNKSGKKDKIMQLQQHRDDELQQLSSKQWLHIPVSPQLVINTPEYIQQHVNLQDPVVCEQLTSATIPFTNLHPLYQEFSLLDGIQQEIVQTGGNQGDKNEEGNGSKHSKFDPDAWKLYAEIIPNVDSKWIQYKWAGIGAIISNKEFYMKNIRDLETHHIAFLQVDKLGAYGLNLKISNAILIEWDNEELTSDVCLQMAGRVGRIGQESCGYVYLTSEQLFRKLMSC